MTNGEYFILTHPNVEVKENGTCVWIYNLDNTVCNHHTMSMEWWNEEMIDIRPKGHWVISKDGTYPICSLCSTRGETQYDGVEPIPKCTSYCSNCGARMEVNDAEVHGNDA